MLFINNILYSSYKTRISDLNWQKLYKLGARKFGILSVPPIGCLPIERAQNVSGGCMDEMNSLARAFYKSTRSLLQQFSSQFKGVKYSLGNTYQMTMSVILSPPSAGMYVYIICISLILSNNEYTK